MVKTHTKTHDRSSGSHTKSQPKGRSKRRDDSHAKAGASHALWSGTLTFGLVSIPVAMSQATRWRRSSFRLLHKGDHGQLRRRMYCPQHDTYVHPEHIVRGYEVEPDKFVIVRDSEIEAIEPDRSKSIEIETFVPLEQIDPLYCRRPYYLVPTAGEKPYRLLVEALEQARKAGISKFVMHDREYLCAIVSIDGALCLQTLYFQQELRDSSELRPAAAAEPAAVKSIGQAIEKLSGDFEPGKLHDAYQDRVDKLIDEKRRHAETFELAGGGEDSDEGGEEMGDVDLVEALEASLAKAKGRKH